MKVPTYTRQTQPTQSTGAIPFGVTASPAALSADTRAATQLGQTVMQEGLRWFESELKLKRSTELNKAESLFKQTLAEGKLASLNRDPLEVMEGSKTKKSFEEEMRDNMLQSANQIDDSVVRRRFMTRANDDLLATKISVFQSARARQVDDAKATSLTLVEQLITDVTSGNTAEANAARIRLFGNKATGAEGIFQTMADGGLIPSTTIANLKLKTTQRIARSEVLNRILDADKSGDPKRAALIRQQLSDPKKFPGLKPEDRNTLYKKSIDLTQQLERQLIAATSKQETTNKKARTERHRVNFSEALGRLIASNDNPNDQEAQALRPTVGEINNLLKADQISSQSAITLINAINDQDSVTDDPELIADAYQDISEAESSEEIDDIVDRLRESVGRGGRLKTSTFVSIKRYADKFRAQAADVQEIKRYRNFIEELSDVTGFQYKSARNIFQAKSRRVDALATYGALVADGMKPRDAFNEISFQLRKAVNANIEFLAPASFLEKYFKGRRPATWTEQNVEDARRAITENKGITHLQKSIEFETLTAITNLLNEKKITDTKKTGKETEKGDDTPIRDFFRDLLGGGDSIRDEAKRLRNRGD